MNKSRERPQLGDALIETLQCKAAIVITGLGECLRSFQIELRGGAKL